MTNFSKPIHFWIILMLLGAVSAWAQTAPTVQWQTSIPEYPVGKPTGSARIVELTTGDYQLFTASALVTSTDRLFSTLIQLLPTGKFKTAQALPAFPVTYGATDLVNTQDGGTLVCGLSYDQNRFFMRKMNTQGNEVWTWLSGPFSNPGSFPQPNSGFLNLVAVELPTAYMLTGLSIFETSKLGTSTFGFRMYVDKSSGMTVNGNFGEVENDLRLAGNNGVLGACAGIDGGMVLATERGLIKVGTNDKINWSVGNGRAYAVIPTANRDGYFAAYVGGNPLDFQFSKIGINGEIIWNSGILASVTTSSNIKLVAEPDGGVVIAINPSSSNDVRLRKFSAVGQPVWQAEPLSGRLGSLARTADGGYVVSTIVQSTTTPTYIRDGRAYAYLEPIFTKFSPEQNTTPPPTVNFALTAPTYNCNTGQLTLNTSGGNGSTIDYRIVGLRDWSFNNIFFVPLHQRNGTTFTLEARQNGQSASLGFATACMTSPPVVNPPVTPPVTPPTGSFAVLTPAYDCNTGQLTAQVANAGGATVEYRIIGLRDWGITADFSVPSYQRNGTTFKIEARTNGGSYATMDFTGACGTIPPVTPPTPPAGTALSFGAPNFDCGSGSLRLITSGGDGSLIGYRVPGLRDWATSPDFTVPTYQRQNTTFTLYARQSGREISTQFTTNCPAMARVANPEIGLSWSVSVLGNPVEDQVQLRLSGLAGQTLGLSLSDAMGRVLSERQVMVQSEGQTEILGLRGSAGVYLVRAISNGQQQTLKVLKK